MIAFNSLSYYQTAAVTQGVPGEKTLYWKCILAPKWVQLLALSHCKSKMRSLYAEKSQNRMSYCHLEGEVHDYKRYLWNSNDEGKVFVWNMCNIKIIGALTYDIWRHLYPKGILQVLGKIVCQIWLTPVDNSGLMTNQLFLSFLHWFIHSLPNKDLLCFMFLINATDINV